jgi:hypothetical protein
MLCTFNPSTQEAEAGRSRDYSQPRLYGQTLAQKYQKQNKTNDNDNKK